MIHAVTPQGEDSDGHGIVAVIPAYNEERFIGSVVLGTLRHASSVIVVDDGSTDATAEIAAAAGAIVVRHAHNQGKGAALNTGIHRAGELQPEAIVTLDGDGQHRPKEIPRLLAPILRGEADLVVGSRYIHGGYGVPRHRIWGQRVFTILTNLISGVRVTDSQSGFRAFSPQAMETIAFSSRRFSVESEMQFLAREHGLRLVEAPVSAVYQDRPKRPIVAHGLIVLNGVLRLVGQYRPLLFFGVPGLVMLLAGLSWGAYVVEIHARSQHLAVGYALLSVLFVIAGSMSLFAGLILHSVRGLLLRSPSSANAVCPLGPKPAPGQSSKPSQGSGPESGPESGSESG
jgi:glycosyltransferase involved in cell wall biosynthesis